MKIKEQITPISSAGDHTAPRVLLICEHCNHEVLLWISAIGIFNNTTVANMKCPKCGKGQFNTSA